MIDRTLAGAFIDNNVEHRILGRRLYPFSLWHRFLLTTIQSPFLKGGELSFFDIREAIGICSLKWPECKVRRPWVIPVLWIFFFGYRKKAWHKFMLKLRDRLMEYFGDYISRPEYNFHFTEAHYGGPSVAPPPRLGPIPAEFLLLADVIGFLHCSVAEAWNTPIGQAYWWQMAFYKNQGVNINFLDEGDREFQAKMREAQEKKHASSK